MSAGIERTCPSEDDLARAITLEDALAVNELAANGRATAARASDHVSASDAALLAHVESCPSCTQVCDATKHALELARRVRVVLPDRERREEMRTAILATLDARDAHDSAGDASDTDDPASNTREAFDAGGARTRSTRRRWFLAGGVLAAAAGVALVLATRDATTHAHGTITAHAGARYTSTRAPDEVVTLHDGTIDVDVAPLHAGERFRVITADTEIEVRGTAFRVVAELGHVIRVEVAHGRVDVRPHDGGVVSLGAGQSWKSAVQTATPSARTGLQALVPTVESNEPTFVPPNEPKLATGARAKSPSSAARDADRPPKQDHDARTAVDDERAAKGDADVPAKPDLTASRPASAPPTRPLDALAYDEGWAAMRGGDFEHAASAFARVTILEPDGALSEDASYWYAVALARAKRGEAIAAFRDLLSRYPHSTHAGEANAMLGWLLVEAKQPAEAERRFRAAIDDPKPSVRDSARSGLAALGR
ncbi:MAG: FecR domain-containing protein [Kofleriaceae bacterium]